MERPPREPLLLRCLKQASPALTMVASLASVVVMLLLEVDLVFVASVLLAGAIVVAWRTLQRRPVYLVDFACYRPPDEYKCTHDKFMYHTELTGAFSEASLAFQKKILSRSGIGEESYAPRSLTSIPMNKSMAEARFESESVMSGALDELFARTGLSPLDIDVLVVNCSLFNPTPSLASIIVNKYKMRVDIASYNLAGMGCSAGVIAIDLAKDLLHSRDNAYAIVVSTENITLNWYLGNDRNMLVTNCLFRMGGAAILLSNRSCERKRAKYELVHTVRTHKGADDTAYRCVFQEEEQIRSEPVVPLSDSDNKSETELVCPKKPEVGVSLSEDLMKVAEDALKTNIITLGPLVLPLSEQLRYLVSILMRWSLRKYRKNHNFKLYVPNFKRAFEHFCVHAGGRKVLDGIEKSLELTPWHMEPSRKTLEKWGNTSSSSLWYELAYCEATGRIHKGDRVWQIAFGSGFKCNSAVWKARRTIDAKGVKNAWSQFLAKK